MSGIFISYRREDAPGHAGRVFDRLRARFGSDVFMDVTGIEAGTDFVDAIDRAIGSCDVLLAVIGPEWTTLTDRSGVRRLDDPNDFIRLEIAKALQRDVRVVPVLVDAARLPGARDLPEELQPLLRRHAIELRDTHWDADVDQLVTIVARTVAPSSADQDRTRGTLAARAGWRRLAAAAAVLLAAAVVGLVLGLRWWESATTNEKVVATPAAPAQEPVEAPPATATQPAPPARTEPDAVADTRPPAPASLSISDARPAAVAPTIRPTAEPPDVTNIPLRDARRRLAAANLTRIAIRWIEAPNVAPEVVVSQQSLRGDSSEIRSVTLSVAARATLRVNHVAADTETARRLISGMRQDTPAGVMIRAQEVTAMRDTLMGRVSFRDENLRKDAEAVARAASAWLTQEYGRQVRLEPTMVQNVLPRLLLMNVPPRR